MYRKKNWVIVLSALILVLLTYTQFTKAYSIKEEKDAVPLEQQQRKVNPQTPKAEFQEDVIREEEQQTEKVVYLTFDDGPAAVTGEILVLLAAYEAKATFFMLEPNMKKYPQFVKRIAEEGHGLGLHGVTHQKKRYYASRFSVLNEMNVARQTLESLTGKSTLLIRTPYGSAPYMKKSYRQAVGEWGYVIWDWNIDSKDWEYRDSRYVQAVKNQLAHVSKSDKPPVILLHEQKTTLLHLENLLKYFKKSGYEMKPITKGIEPVQFKATH